MQHDYKQGSLQRCRDQCSGRMHALPCFRGCFRGCRVVNGSALPMSGVLGACLWSILCCGWVSGGSGVLMSTAQGVVAMCASSGGGLQYNP